MTPLEIVLVPLRDGHRWRARATGTVNGEQRTVRHEAHDRGEAVREATIRWFATYG